MAVARVTLPGEFAEENTMRIRGRFLDDLGQPIPLVGLDSLTLTLYSDATKAIINGVENTDIRNVGRGIVSDLDGTFSVKLGVDDMIILDDSLTTETHVALIIGTYNGVPEDGFSREVVFKVRNLAKVLA